MLHRRRIQIVLDGSPKWMTDKIFQRLCDVQNYSSRTPQGEVLKYVCNPESCPRSMIHTVWCKPYPPPSLRGCSNLEQVINDILLWIYQHVSWWTSRSMKLWSIQLFGCDHYIHTVAIETCTTAGYANKCVHCESLHSQSWITWDYPMRLYE